MKRNLHALAGIVGFLLILTFWTSTVYAELFGGKEMIVAVKGLILWGMLILVPTMALAGASGIVLGRRRKDELARFKKRRMPVIAANGVLILVPAAIFLEARASADLFDALFYTVQAVELLAGAVNLVLMGLNIRDGRAMVRLRRAT